MDERSVGELWSDFAQKVAAYPDWLTTADRIAIGIKLMAARDAVYSGAPNSIELIACAAETLKRAFSENIPMDAPDELDAEPASSEAALG